MEEPSVDKYNPQNSPSFVKLFYFLNLTCKCQSYSVLPDNCNLAQSADMSLGYHELFTTLGTFIGQKSDWCKSSKKAVGCNQFTLTLCN